MSGYDLAVWFSDVAPSREQAADFLQHVTRDWVILRRHTSFDTFWIELHDRFPETAGGSDHLATLASPPMAMVSSMGEIEFPVPADAGDARAVQTSLDETVWASSPHSANGCAAVLSVAWNHAVQVVPEIKALAARHGLTVFDTQSGEVSSLPGLQSGGDPAGARLRLEVAGARPALDGHVLLDGEPVLSFVATSRLEAHGQARSVALEHGLQFYEVVDPGSLAQLLPSRPKPISADDPDLSPVAKFLVGFTGVPSRPK
jgi:hypothetical protein